MDDSQHWGIRPVRLDELYANGVPPGGPWTVATFGTGPVDEEALRRFIGDPFED